MVTEEPTARAQLALVLDCADNDRLARFWCAVLGYRRVRAVDPYVSLAPSDGKGPELLLQRVPEPKRGKNRMHLDLRVPRLEPELSRLQACGATVLRGPFDDNGILTTVLADPEGNEFCLLVWPGS
ncbi:VOC family protein [Streptomyces albus subsp. chlorinus]|uniref:VOC family protein n=1 Tax=Streptomyces albus TaxID=1888 RepID=UPI00156F6292|nr:VOC family protein [Streptomyces albus]NSC25391.1 VOC family protein [Streptomyces albus subsp. chlorinus]